MPPPCLPAAGSSTACMRFFLPVFFCLVCSPEISLSANNGHRGGLSLSFLSHPSLPCVFRKAASPLYSFIVSFCSPLHSQPSTLAVTSLSFPGSLLHRHCLVVHKKHRVGEEVTPGSPFFLQAVVPLRIGQRQREICFLLRASLLPVFFRRKPHGSPVIYLVASVLSACCLFERIRFLSVPSGPAFPVLRKTKCPLFRITQSGFR